MMHITVIATVCNAATQRGYGSVIYLSPLLLQFVMQPLKEDMDLYDAHHCYCYSLQCSHSKRVWICMMHITVIATVCYAATQRGYGSV